MPKIYGYTEVFGDMIIMGSFSITGSASIINTTNLVVVDPIILLSYGQTGPGVLDSGFLIDRGTGATQGFIWDESTDQFALISTNDNHTAIGNINITGYSDLRLGNILIDGNAGIGTITPVTKLHVVGSKLGGEIQTIENTFVGSGSQSSVKIALKSPLGSYGQPIDFTIGSADYGDFTRRNFEVFDNTNNFSPFSVQINSAQFKSITHNTYYQKFVANSANIQVGYGDDGTYTNTLVSFYNALTNQYILKLNLGITTIGNNVDVSYNYIKLPNNQSSVTIGSRLTQPFTIYNDLSSKFAFSIDNNGDTHLNQESGNTIIGSYSTPTSRLHIIGSNSAYTDYALKIDNSSTSPLLYVRNDSHGAFGSQINDNFNFTIKGNNNSYGGISGTLLVTDTSASVFIIGTSTDGGINIDNGSPGSSSYINLKSQGVVKLYLQSVNNGFNYIGSSQYTFIVNNSNNTNFASFNPVDGNWVFSGPTSSLPYNQDSIISIFGVSSTTNILKVNNNLNNPLLYVTNSGNIGIGTDTPTAKLHVKGSAGYNQLRLQTSYTPTSTSDVNGNTGDIAWDDSFTYVKTSTGWKRTTLSTF